MAVRPYIGALVSPTERQLADWGWKARAKTHAKRTARSRKSRRRRRPAPPSVEDSPSSHLRLEAVHGYSAANGRNAIAYVSGDNATPTIVYPAACVGIALRDANRRDQTLALGHEGKILSLTTDPLSGDVATGAGGKTPAIRCWSARDGTAHATLAGFHKRGVVLLGEAVGFP